MRGLTRRRLLQRVASSAISAPAIFRTNGARAQLPPLPPLPNLPASDALLLRPGDAHFGDYQSAFNARTMLTPQLRALCKNASAVGVMIDWCRSKQIAFALRCGGHSYEGFSQSSSVVIDTRMMNSIAVDTQAKTASVGAGTSLGDLYRAIAPRGFAFPGGSCPTVGVSGHLLGGGYGYLARPFGLACDNLLSVDLVDPGGKQVQADGEQNKDVFWACRGGGGGSFGAATRYRLNLIKLANVFTFNIRLPPLQPARAAAIMKEWQAWAPKAPKSIDSNVVIIGHSDGTISLRCAGQSIGSSKELQRELRFLSSSVQPVQRSFIDAVTYFAGSDGWKYASAPMKGKSDYVAAPLSDEGLATLMGEIARRPAIYVICDSYGGAIAAPSIDATAFAHRSDLFCIQYGSTWSNPGDTPRRLRDMNELYAAMRPFVSGGAYINYCDRDLVDWPQAYWGENLSRLKQVKTAFDPDNVFQHAQSVPRA
jgi:FAD/FMN-containing dehydrogenase